MTDSEQQRIAEVYGEYSRGKVSRWSMKNKGNQSILAERSAIIARELSLAGIDSLSDKRVLECGSGSGGELSRLRDLGAADCNLHGFDLLGSRVRTARATHNSLSFLVADGRKIPFRTATFDVVLLMTVFSSVDESIARDISIEVARVLNRKGAIIWYDLKMRNPRNSNVRPIGRDALAEYFPGFTRGLRSATVLPPIARILGPASPLLYPMLSAFPWLQSHYVAVLTKI